MYRAIDIHAHLGTPDGFPQKGLGKSFLNRSPDQVERSYRQQNIVAGSFSPMEGIFPADEYTLLKANETMQELSETYPWIYQWVIVDPLFPASYRQAEELLKTPKCIGVKLHPDGNGYPIAVYGEEIFSFCSQFDAVVETHTGDPMSQPEEFVPFADRYPNVKIILSHIGCGFDGCLSRQTDAVRRGKNHNLYTDTSSGKSILNGLIEWASDQVAEDRILFGTDSPIHHIGMMKQRIETAEISENRRKDILCRNAEKLFPGVFDRI